jgi:hypothetical protein
VKPKYDFYEIVRVISPKKRGHEGAVLGRAQNENGKWGYAVALYSDDKLVWDFQEDELEPTGRKDRRESFYDGTTIRVQVDPDTGEGTIVDWSPPRQETGTEDNGD